MPEALLCHSATVITPDSAQAASICVSGVMAADATVDFIARRRSYVRTFGEENIEFIPIVAVDDIATAENVVKDALAQWRVRHTNGRLHEWMVGIERAELQPVILEALARAGIV